VRVGTAEGTEVRTGTTEVTEVRRRRRRGGAGRGGGGTGGGGGRGEGEQKKWVRKRWGEVAYNIPERWRRRRGAGSVRRGPLAAQPSGSRRK
jgi:hypothetical protein